MVAVVLILSTTPCCGCSGDDTERLVDGLGGGPFGMVCSGGGGDKFRPLRGMGLGGGLIVSLLLDLLVL